MQFWFKSLSVKAVWCWKDTKWISQQWLESWKHRQSAEENLQDGYNCLATRQQETVHSSRSSGEPHAQSEGQAKKAPISSWDFAWNCHSLFKCTQENNSPWSIQLTCFERCRSCSLSEANRISRLTRCGDKQPCQLQ